MSTRKTNVIEWTGVAPDDVIWGYPYEDIRWGSVVVVHEYEWAVFLRDGKAYDVFQAGRHVITTQNLPLLTRAFNFLAGYGETPFKANVIFVSQKQFKGRFGTNTRVKLGPGTLYMTEAQTYGEYFYRVEDPLLFLTQLAGATRTYSSPDVTNFIRSFFQESFMQELAKYPATEVYANLENVSSKIKTGTVCEGFKQRGLELLDLKMAGFSLPLLEKLEKEDPTYGLPLIVAIQGGDNNKVLEITRTVESMRALGKSPGAGIFGAIWAIPAMLGQPGYQAQPPGPTPPAVPSGEKSAINRLKELKDMLDAGLITNADFEEAKKKILAQMAGS